MVAGVNSGSMPPCHWEPAAPGPPLYRRLESQDPRGLLGQTREVKSSCCPTDISFTAEVEE